MHRTGAWSPRPTTDSAFLIPLHTLAPDSMAAEEVVLKLTPRQAEALRALAALEELPPAVYAAEVLVKHLYHAYTPQVAARAAGHPPAGPK
jgi:hypothetical protein